MVAVLGCSGKLMDAVAGCVIHAALSCHSMLVRGDRQHACSIAGGACSGGGLPVAIAGECADLERGCSRVRWMIG